MPLASRATQARAARTDSSVEAPPKDQIKDAVQPRKGKPAVAPEPDTNEGAQKAQESTQQAAAPAPAEKAPRKQRTPRTAPQAVTSAGTTDVKALRARQKAIETEFKELASREKIAMRELAAKFKADRVALESEHRLIANQLSAAVFNPN